MQKYLVVFERAGEKYTAYVPDIPGCFAAGATLSEAENNIHKAIRRQIQSIVQKGEPLPEGAAFSEYIEI